MSDGDTRNCGQVKRSLKTSVCAVAAVAALAASLLACTSEQQGLPTPVNSTSATNRPTLPGGGGTSGSRTTSPNGSSGGNPIRAVDVCTLLTSGEQSQLAVRAGVPKDGQTDMDKGCIWRSAQQAEFLIQVNAYGNLGHKDAVSTAGVKTLPNVGKHKAIQFSLDPICAVSLAITDSSRVDATATTGTNVQKACEIAAKVAQMIEPKLPSGS